MMVTRAEIQAIIDSIQPFDQLERDHISFIQKWISSGAEIFRTAKPATPDPHLVSYFLPYDKKTNKLLLVDHKAAKLWLPAGGHVEVNEHPKETVKREIVEELSVEADFHFHDPLMVTATMTEGQEGRHTDVSLWYLLKGDSTTPIQFDRREFHGVSWYGFDEIPYEQADPHMKRFIAKMQKNGIVG